MFKVGDKVRSLVDIFEVRTKGKIYEITDVDSESDSLIIWYKGDNGLSICTTDPKTFELVKDVKTRTKEIDVWVEDYDTIHDIVVYHVDELSDLPQDDNFFKERNLLKAKLIVDIPEKTVTISESEFDKAYEEAMNDETLDFKKQIKKSLGL